MKNLQWAQDVTKQNFFIFRLTILLSCLLSSKRQLKFWLIIICQQLKKKIEPDKFYVGFYKVSDISPHWHC